MQFSLMDAIFTDIAGSSNWHQPEGIYAGQLREATR